MIRKRVLLWTLVLGAFLISTCALAQETTAGIQGVVRDSSGAVMAGATVEVTGSGFGGFQIDGASDGENVYMVDGVNITNIQNGGVGKSFQMEFVQEVQIKSSSFEAEYGGALGGVINVIPKHGSNDWHGSVLG